MLLLLLSLDRLAVFGDVVMVVFREIATSVLPSGSELYILDLAPKRFRSGFPSMRNKFHRQIDADIR